MQLSAGLIILLSLTLASSRVPKRPVSPRIIGGHSVNIYDYPYMVSVLFRANHLCGGSLIKYDYVLTAAHCVYDGQASDFSVRAGSSIINDGGVVQPVFLMWPHPDFNDQTYQNDVAVLKLTTEFFPSSGIKPIGLPDKGEELEAETLGAVTGWGRISEFGPFPDKLQEVDIPVVTLEHCTEIHGSGEIDDGMFCAGYKTGGKDTCRGDSGGPFVANGKQYGITSWGDECGLPDSPGVYAKVAYFRDYIDSVMKE